MKRKILSIMIAVAMTCTFTACGNEEDTGVIIGAGDLNNDTAGNSITPETEDTESVETEVESTEDTEDTVEEQEATAYMQGGFVSDAGDVYEFGIDNQMTGYIASTGESLTGEYETDDSSYITIRYNSVVYGEVEFEFEEATEEVTEEIPYRTESIINEDGSMTVLGYNENDEIISETVTSKEEMEALAELSEENTEDANNVTYENELTYSINRTTVEDADGIAREVVILTKGDITITLQKEYEIK